MAIVVEQTIPFPAHALDLENPSRWNRLFPLIRPSVKTVQTAKGQTILVDQAASNGRHVCIAAVGVLGNFSSKLLQDRHVTAIVIEQKGAGILTARDIAHAIESGLEREVPGVVVVRSAKTRRVAMLGPDLLEAEVNGDLAFDHVLRLLGTASESTRTSIHQIAELLKLFNKTASTTHSSFHTEKAGANPVLVHADGHAAYEKAKHAIERDLKHVMRAHASQSGSVTYSVHYSDVNGLSRLENFILAMEIGKFFEAQNLPYALSTSTLLQHDKPARGFAISICPVPNHILKAQEKSTNPLAHTAAETPKLSKMLSPSSTMTFSDSDVRRRIESGCNTVIAEEPAITEYDTIVGDGDCGYTLRDGAKQVLRFIAGKDLSQLPLVVGELVNDLEVNMGGTSGALYCIFLTAFSSSLASSPSVSAALKGALETLMSYTRARLGDRTMLDCLIPFVDVLQRTDGDAAQALAEARKGVESTKELEAKLGRSTYLEESATRGVPDPGAYGLLVLLEGMCKSG